MQDMFGTDLGPEFTEYGMVITWVNWQDAGAQGPTSRYDGIIDKERRDSIVRSFRLNRAIRSVELVQRQVRVSEWVSTTPVPITTSDEEREALFKAQFERDLFQNDKL